MTDATELDGLDPYAAQAAEAARIDAFLSSLADDDPAWHAPTGCAAWNRYQLLCHLAATEEYHQACFDDQLGPLFEKFVASGATDLHGFNQIGVDERARRAPSDVLAEWRRADERTRRLFRERGDADMATSVGPYPARWQAFHVASELATHADDLGVPVPPADVEARLGWRARFSRFALVESKPEVIASVGADGTTVIAGDRRVVVDDATLVAAVAGRLPPDEGGLDADERALLSTAP